MTIIIITDLDRQLMREAAEEARRGVAARDGGPFGAVVVKNGKIIAAGHNTVLKNCDPTLHAEVMAIKSAALVLNTHDLSDCEIYTSCEPCPMCWSACMWARLKRIYVGADRKTAAKFGFDDEFIYKELEEAKVRRTVKCYYGLLTDHVEQAFFASATHRRRLLSGDGALNEMFVEFFDKAGEDSGLALPVTEDHAKFMQAAVEAAKEGANRGDSKEREPFGAVIVKGGQVIATAHNCVLKNRDPTATAEMECIRAAARTLGTHILTGCDMYTTTEPDPMSLAAIYWARIETIYVGVSQRIAAKFGFEDGLVHYKELATSNDKRILLSVENVESEICEKVFEEFKMSQGQIY